MPNWIFDETGASPYTTGANQTEKLFGGRGSLIKEGIQNAVDKISNTELDLPGHIEITLHELSGTAKSDFLDTLDWDTLKKHVGSSCLEGKAHWQVLMSERYKNVEDKSKPLRVLIFSDYGPKGLEGENEYDEHSDFGRLCRAEQSTDFATANRSGSKGLGKVVFWKHSGINTVLFGSLTKKAEVDDTLSMRLFGQCLISTHQVGGERFQPIGFFGKTQTDNKNREFATSLWDDNVSAEKLMLRRDPLTDRTGTSVMVIDYEEIDQVSSSGEEIINKLRNDVEKWFWPALSSWNGAPPIVSVKLTFLKNFKSQFTVDASPDSYKEFQSTVNSNPTVNELSNPGDIACNDELEVTVLKIEGHKGVAVDAKIGVRLSAVAPGVLSDDVTNTVALLRNLTMVIQYERIQIRLADGIDACGVVAAGYAHGSNDSDAVAHDFLRHCEPPAHDNWKYDDDIRGILGAMARRDKVIKTYKKEIKKLGVAAVDTSGRPVDALGAMLRFSGGGKVQPKRTVFLSETSLISRDLKSGKIKISFKLNFNTATAAPWSRKLLFKIKGPNFPLAVENYSDSSEKCKKWRIDSEGLELTTEDSKFVGGEVILMVPSFFNKKDITNLAVDIVIKDLRGE